MRRIALLVIAAFLLAAEDGGAAVWRQVTASDGANTDQVAVHRTADGVLHVGWRHRSGPTTEDLLHTAIAANGQIGATTPIVAGWSVVQNPALVGGPGGLRVFFGGIRTTAFDEPNRELNTALSPDGGTTWVLQVGSVVPVGAQAYGSPVSATVLPNGMFLQAWAGTLGTWAHAGLSPASPSFDYQGALGPYGYDTGLASDRSGRAVMAWYSNATGHLGVHTQAVAPAGNPLGAPATMPGTTGMLVGMIGRTPIVARSGGGFYVAYATGYPALNRVLLWRVGESRASLVATTATTGSATATVAAAPDGRVWVAWTNPAGGSPRVLARRSNRAATTLGAVVAAGRPSGASSIYRLDASATAGALDLLALASLGAQPATATWQTRIRPGLTLQARPARLRRRATSAVAFTVLDAGDPVRGARVRVGRRSGTTNRQGRVTLLLVGRGRSLTASASAAGYVGATVRLPVSAR